MKCPNCGCFDVHVSVPEFTDADDQDRITVKAKCMDCDTAWSVVYAPIANVNVGSVTVHYKGADERHPF